ncbi:hypothetical protein [Halorussus salinus]|uniref:hypothetical protein n=1 Tax=Halorussus salinus TaxID=1364935 RepID=UPI001093125E|nr:hypothetical protein [Halorussus salinus]
MDDALRIRLDAIILLLVVVATLLALTLAAVGGGEWLVFAFLLGFVSVTVTYSILVGDEHRGGDGKTTGPTEED